MAQLTHDSPSATITEDQDRLLTIVTKAVTRKSFATLATVSPAGRPHAAGVLYAAVAENGRLQLFVNTNRHSRKARNIATNPRVALSIPVRRIPVGPPSSIQFQAETDILALDDPEIVRLLDSGALKPISGHGEMDDPENCIVRITPAGTIHTYGLGMSLLAFIRDPLNAFGSVDLPERINR